MPEPSLDNPPGGAPRMLWCLALGLALLLAADFWQIALPRSQLPDMFAKAALLALGGWAGYWLDRALFPYDRPHRYLLDPDDALDEAALDGAALAGESVLRVCAGASFGHAMLRRAIVVAACLLCLALGR